jgi:transcriptional regulator with XRE-family HTH domain
MRIVAHMTENGHGARTLAAVVVDRRSDLGLTQAELALKANIDRRTVQNIEAGKRPIPLTLAAIARALGMETAELRRIADSEPADAKAS